MSIIVSTKNGAIFLATLLVLGTIATISPSFMVGAQALPQYGMEREYGSYEQPEYGMDSYDNKSYGKDSYKSKDSSSAIVKKVKCNNINANVNGLEITALPPALSGLLASEAEAADEGQYGASSYGSGEGSYGSGGQSGSDKDFKFVCINNNNNTVIEEEETPVTPVEECAEADEIEACFANAEFMFGGVEFPEFVEALEAGITVEINGQDITLRSFNDICLAFEGLTTYEQLTDAVGEIEDATGANFGEGFFAVVNCLAEAIGIPIPSG